MTIQSTQQNQQMHVRELYSSRYSSPTCFNCCCGHHQGN